ETYYGIAKNQTDIAKDKLRLHVRVALKDLKPKDIADICDAHIRRQLAYIAEGLGEKEAISAIQKFAKANNMRRVRVTVEKSRKAMRPIRDKEGRIYRYVATGGNHHLDIFCPIKDRMTADGKKYKAG